MLIRLSVLFFYIFSIAIATSFQVQAKSHSGSVILIDSPIQDTEKIPPHKAPKILKEDDKSSTKGKAPTALQVAIDVGTNVIKTSGGPKKFFSDLFGGYKKIYDEGIINGNAKRNARIARGEAPTFLTDFADGFTSTFVPSIQHTYDKLGRPVVKVFVFTYFGINLPI